MSEKLRDRFTAPGPKRILALDGGGSRGLFTLGVLAKLEHHLAERSGTGDAFRLSHYFDLIGGTSTGSIIATTLALGWRVNDVVALYFDLLPSIFAKPQANGIWRLTKPAYKNTALSNALQDKLEDRTLGSDDLQTGLAIFCKRIDTGSAWIVCNNPDWVYYGPTEHSIGNCDLRLKDLVQASAAAPTYFLPVEIHLGHEKGGENATMVDGGVSPNNNPALQLLITATSAAYGFNWMTGEENLLLWSVGTGYVRKQFKKKSRKRRSSAEPLSRFRAYSSKVQASLEGYNHDISQQQISMLQSLSRPRFPWYVNSELRGQTVGEPLTPLFTYQRYDVRLEIDNEEYRRPEHIESLLGREMSAKDCAKLREMDIGNAQLLDMLYSAGEALGDAQLYSRASSRDGKELTAPAISADWPPAAFDPHSWRKMSPPVA